MALNSLRKSFISLHILSSRRLSLISTKNSVKISFQHVRNGTNEPVVNSCNWCRQNHRNTFVNNNTNSMIFIGRSFSTKRENHLSCLSRLSKDYSINTTQKCGVVTSTGKKIPLAKSIPPRRLKKKYIEDPDDSHYHKNVVAYAVGEELNLEALKCVIMTEDVYNVVQLPIDVTDAFMVTAKYRVNGQSREAFFFSDGGVACWHMSETERQNLWQLARSFAINPYEIELINKENETLSVLYDSSSTVLVGDTVHLKAFPSDEEKDTDTELKLHKYAFSNALSQSVSLAISEANLQTFIEQLEPETQKLRQGVKSRLTKKQINMRLGEVFLMRHEINLESGFLDVPDIYWEREELEGFYRQMISYLSMPKRVKVLNERLDYCSEILQLFNSQLNDQHHVRLEWIIIILILIEVVFECEHYADKYGLFDHSSTEQGTYTYTSTSDQKLYTRPLPDSAQSKKE